LKPWRTAKIDANAECQGQETANLVPQGAPFAGNSGVLGPSTFGSTKAKGGK
jgi:hypothetical protein